MLPVGKLMRVALMAVIPPVNYHRLNNNISIFVRKIMPTKSFLQIILGICLLSSQWVLSAQSPESVKFKLVNQYNVGGEGKWDLLTFDTKHHRLFVSRATHVQVIDA